ncbi:hypothetical protein HY450_02640 [Candidatus Pacearchaeota archaeon]|nr:hypothetical protein [Candidatus Pacearchaeota archaeon]
MVEYVKVSKHEVFYGQKNLLNSELEILSMLKGHDSYKELRKEEFALKIALKTKIDEAFNSLNALQKTLPKTNESDEKSERTEKQSKKRLTLQEEIYSIREKLAKLNSGVQ